MITNLLLARRRHKSLPYGISGPSGGHSKYDRLELSPWSSAPSRSVYKANNYDLLYPPHYNHRYPGPASSSVKKDRLSSKMLLGCGESLLRSSASSSR